MKNNTSPNREKIIAKLFSWLKKPWVMAILFLAMISLAATGAAFISKVNYYLEQINSKGFSTNINITGEMRKNKPVTVSTIGNFSLGADNPEITIVKFSDFSCPYCQAMSLKLRNVLKKYPTKVKIVYKDYPVINAEGIDFAMAARCAGEQNETFFWLMHDELFNLQGLITPAGLPDAAAALGIDKEKFIACMDSEKYMEPIKNDAAEAESLGVKNTPTLFINGHVIAGDIPEEILTQVVGEFLENK